MSEHLTEFHRGYLDSITMETRPHMAARVSLQLYQLILPRALRPDPKGPLGFENITYLGLPVLLGSDMADDAFEFVPLANVIKT